MDRNILLAIIAIVLIVIVGFFVFANPGNGKTNTSINFLGESTIHNGDTVSFELKDASGKALSNQNVSIAYKNSTGNIEKYDIITDKDGKGFLAISGEDPGKYDITITFNDTDKYNGCTAQKTITIEAGDSTAAKETTPQNSTASTVKYHHNVTQSSSSSSGSSSGSSSSQSTSSQGEDPKHQYVAQLYYDSVLGVYYDDFGVVRGGPYDGNEIADLWDAYNRGEIKPVQV